MQSKLYETLINYCDKNPVRFHMPGINGKDIGLCSCMDITELSFSDNLIDSNGIIKNTENNIAKAYSTNFALMLTCGATSGVAISLFVAKQYGNNLLIVGDCHKCVFNYASIFGLNITKIESFDNDIDFDNFDCIVLTTPNYFGKTTNIDKLKNCNALKIVDASHGSHFAFCSKLPNLPTDIADITILSFHKTLPVLTGGAGIVCNNQEIFDKLVYARSLIHSSSPSYLIMASIDKAIVNFFENGEKLYQNVFNHINNFKNTLNDNFTVEKTDDKTRLCIGCKGKNANQIKNILEQNNIFVEMTYQDILVLIVTPYNSDKLEILSSVLNDIDVDQISLVENDNICQNQTKTDINANKIKFLPLAECAGKISASNIGIYPPGTPIIRIGDKITQNNIKFLQNTDLEIFGFVNGKTPVYED